MLILSGFAPQTVNSSVNLAGQTHRHFLRQAAVYFAGRGFTLEPILGTADYEDPLPDDKEPGPEIGGSE